MSDSRNLIVSNPKDLSAYLERSRGAIAMALPAHLKPERMLRLALTAFSTTPKLRECTAHSILASIVVASQIGLEPGVAGQGYLIPYKTTCTFVPGWQGLVGLLNNSGRATAWTGAVFEGDEWDFQLGSNPRCFHKPGPNYGDAAKMIWVYACGQVNGSQMPVVEAWPISRVWRHRDKFNKVGTRHYSYEHPEMYARKVVLLQVLKYMPRSVELNNAMTAANAAEAGRRAEVVDGTVIDIEDPTLPTGNVGADPQTEPKELGNGNPQEQQTPAAGAAAASAKKEPEKPKDNGPTKEQLQKNVLKAATAHNIGKKVLIGKCIEMGHLPEGAEFDALQRDQLAAVLDIIEDVIAAILAK